MLVSTTSRIATGADADAPHWTAYLESLADLLGVDHMALLARGQNLVAVVARGARKSPQSTIAALTDALARHITTLDGPVPNVVRLPAGPPTDPQFGQGLSETGFVDHDQASTFDQAWLYAIEPLQLGSSGEVWLAAVLPPEQGRTDTQHEVLQRLRSAAALVATLMREEARAVQASYQDLVDGLAEAAPMSCILSDRGVLVAQSVAMGRLLDAGNFASRSPVSELRLATPRASSDLQTALVDLAASAADGRLGQRIVPLDLASDAKSRWLAIVRPLPAAALRRTALPVLHMPRPVCWVSLRAPHLAALPTVADLRQAYAFTESEAELVHHLMQGRSAASQAAERGVTADAASYHMKNIYQQTGCKRHAELVMLMQATLGPCFAHQSESKA